MFKKLQKRWYAQSTKDQIYLMVGVVAIGVFLLWALLCQPLIDWRNQEQKHLVNLIHTLKTVESLAHRIQQRSQQGINTAEKRNLAEIIDTSLRDSNLRMKGFQPGRDGQARVYLENSAYKPLVQWLYDLEYTHDIQILELNLGQTQTAGELTVSVTVGAF